MEARLVRTVPSATVRPGRPVPVTVAGRRIVLLRRADGALFAVDGACPHQGHPLTHAQFTADGAVECPHHFYTYDPTDGHNCFPGDGPSLAVFEVVERDGWVWVAPERR